MYVLLHILNYIHICFKHYILGYLNYASDKLRCFFSREETTRADILSSPKNIETDITILHIYIFVKFFNTKVWKKYKIFLLCGQTNIRGLGANGWPTPFSPWAKRVGAWGGDVLHVYMLYIYIDIYILPEVLMLLECLKYMVLEDVKNH